MTQSDAAGKLTANPPSSHRRRSLQINRTWRPISTGGAPSCYRGGAKKTYIRAKGYPSVPFDGYQAQLTKAAEWRVHELPCGHDAMVDQPAELTEMLVSAA